MPDAAFQAGLFREPGPQRGPRLDCLRARRHVYDQSPSANVVGGLCRWIALSGVLVGGLDDALREIVQGGLIVGIAELDPSTREDLGKRRLIFRTPAG